MNDEISGIVAALSAPLFMAVGFVIWDTTWKISGGSAFALNLYKCNLASIGFIITGFMFGFTINDEDNNNNNKNNKEGSTVGIDYSSILYLILSGFIGIIVGDLAWLEALRQIGASRVLIVDTLKPFAAAIFGYVLLGEAIHNIAFSGILLTVLGILLVGMEREQQNEPTAATAIKVDNEDEDQQSVSSTSERKKERSINNDNDEEVAVNINSKPSSNSSTGSNNDNDSNVVVNSQQHDNEIAAASPQQHELEMPTITLSKEQQQRGGDGVAKSKKTLLWNKRRGYALAIGNIFLDTWGSVLTKQHGTQYTTWAINLIRFGSAGLIMMIVSFIMRINERRRANITARRDDNGITSSSASGTTTPWYRLPHQLNRNGWLKISSGVLFVTFCCPALSNYALFKIVLALALTLGSVSPMYALLLEWMFYGAAKKPSIRAIGGASLAIAGVVILALFNAK